MQVSDEAVEAAAKVFHQDGWEGPPFWESLDSDDPSRLEYVATARAALESAVSHMFREAKAEAWDEGATAGAQFQWQYERNSNSAPIPDLANPYRPTK